MSTAPIVSIITPAYNAAAYLAATVETALKQTFQDFELVIIDDGSTDQTPELARQLAERDSRVRVCRFSNAGSAAARNKGLKLARGKYFAFLDSDDLWHPEFLSQQMALFERYPRAAIITVNAYNLGGPFDGRPLRPIDAECRELSLLDIIENEEAMCIMSVFSRAVYDCIGGLDDTAAHNEDYDYWLRAAEAGFAIVSNPKPLAYYRRHVTSKSADQSGMIHGIISVYRKAEARCAGRTAELAALHRQIARFEQQQLFEAAKQHLRGHDFETAARNFRALSELRGDFASHAIARLSALCPRALLLAYRAKSALRRSAPTASPTLQPGA